MSLKITGVNEESFRQAKTGDKLVIGIEDLLVSVQLLAKTQTASGWQIEVKVLRLTTKVPKQLAIRFAEGDLLAGSLASQEVAVGQTYGDLEIKPVQAAAA